ncbi:MAG: hypothetical protein Kow0025_13800 [Thermodesulfovibrionales bacterium]
MRREEPEAPEVRNDHQRETIPLWFVIGAVAVAAFCVYYVIQFWGGLGPGVPQAGGP